MMITTASSLKFNPPVLGHRGACGYAPENTMTSFVKAAQLGSRWLEFDIMLAATGEIVIFHDEDLDRTTNGHGPLNRYSLDYLRTLDAGSWFAPQFAGERIPILIEVLQLMRDMQLNVNIELKPIEGEEDELVDRVLFELNASGLYTPNSPQILFSSFSVPALALLREQAPKCQIGVCLHEWERGWEEQCDELDCVSVHVFEEILGEEKAKLIKEMGKKLLSYTVNNRQRAQTLFGIGCDAVFSDFPDVV